MKKYFPMIISLFLAAFINITGCMDNDDSENPINNNNTVNNEDPVNTDDPVKAAYSEVVYVVEDGYETSVRSMDADGSNDSLLRIGADLYDTVIRKLAVSSDHSRFAYILGDQSYGASDPSNTRIVFGKAGGTSFLEFTNDPLIEDCGSQGDIALSPDGEKLAYSDGLKIYTLSIGSSTSEFSSETSITGGPYIHSLTWSRDGSRIAFAGYKWDSVTSELDTAHSGIYTVNYSDLGNSLTPSLQVNHDTLDTLYITSISWSPQNSDLIAISSFTLSTNSQIFIWNTSTGTKTTITESSLGNALNPRWSQDGESLFFDLNNKIYRISLDDLTSEEIKGESSSLSGFKFRS